jgi:hypothetical protein
MQVRAVLDNEHEVITVMGCQTVRGRGLQRATGFYPVSSNNRRGFLAVVDVDWALSTETACFSVIVGIARSCLYEVPLHLKGEGQVVDMRRGRERLSRNVASSGLFI